MNTLGSRFLSWTHTPPMSDLADKPKAGWTPDIVTAVVYTELHLIYIWALGKFAEALSFYPISRHDYMCDLDPIVS